MSKSTAIDSIIQDLNKAGISIQGAFSLVAARYCVPETLQEYIDTQCNPPDFKFEGSELERAGFRFSDWNEWMLQGTGNAFKKRKLTGWFLLIQYRHHTRTIRCRDHSLRPFFTAGGWTNGECDLVYGDSLENALWRAFTVQQTYLESLEQVKPEGLRK